MKFVATLLLMFVLTGSFAQVKKPSPVETQEFLSGTRKSLSITYKHTVADQYDLSISPLKKKGLKFKVKVEYFDKLKNMEGMELYCAPWQDVKEIGAVPFSFRRNKNFKRTDYVLTTVEYYYP